MDALAKVKCWGDVRKQLLGEFFVAVLAPTHSHVDLDVLSQFLRRGQWHRWAIEGARG